MQFAFPTYTEAISMAARRSAWPHRRSAAQSAPAISRPPGATWDRDPDLAASHVMPTRSAMSVVIGSALAQAGASPDVSVSGWSDAGRGSTKALSFRA